jgi:hypothetical protein
MSQMGRSFSNSGPGGFIQTLTGNSGGPVGPTGGNIDLLGTGVITVVGNPGTSTLTITPSGSIASSFITNPATGTATPVAGVLTFAGAGSVSVSAAGSTVTITGTGTPNNVYTYTNVATTPYVVLTTDVYISVDASGGVRTIQLPNAATLGQFFIIKDRTGSAAANNITITTVGGAVNIDGATTFVMNTAYESVNVIGNGTSYEVF